MKGRAQSRRGPSGLGGDFTLRAIGRCWREEGRALEHSQEGREVPRCARAAFLLRCLIRGLAPHGLKMATRATSI